MIIKHSANNEFVLFEPEDGSERNKLLKFPGLLRSGLSFYCVNKPHVVYSLYERLRARIKTIKVTPAVSSIVNEPVQIKQIPEDFHFHTKPLPSQLLTLRFGYTFGSFMNLSEPGLGKTKATLDYIFLTKKKKSLVVCPKALLFVWEDEPKVHRPELKVYSLASTDWAKELPGIDKADLVVVNYDKAVTLEAQLKSCNFDFIAVDEGLIKDPKTERTKSLLRLAQDIPSRCVMSGTLVNNSPLDVFTPLKFTEPSLVGDSYWNFKTEYAVSAKTNQNVVVGFRKIPEIQELIASCSIIMTKAEWLKDLPKKEFHHIYVQMGDVQEDYYHRLASTYILIAPELEVEVEVGNPLSVLAKLTQISNGFLYYYNPAQLPDENLPSDETGDLGIPLGPSRTKSSSDEPKKKRKARSLKDRRVLVFEHQPKIKALLELIEGPKFDSPTEPGNKRRSIIWFNLAQERELIAKALTDNGHTFLEIVGGTKNIGDIVRRFNSDPSIRFLLCQAKTINYGVTVLGSDSENEEDLVLPPFDSKVADEIFYSLNYSLEVFLQQQDRIHRIGQTLPCNYWLLLTNSRAERAIAQALEDKLAVNRTLLIDVVERFREQPLQD